MSSLEFDLETLKVRFALDHFDESLFEKIEHCEIFISKYLSHLITLLQKNTTNIHSTHCVKKVMRSFYSNLTISRLKDGKF